MTLGKKELMAAVIVGIAGLAAAVHFLVFQKKAQTYDQTSQDYKAAVEQLSSAEFIRDQQAFEQYKDKTTEYSSLVTSVVAELNLQKLDLPTSPPAGAVDQWASQTIALLTELNALRQGQVNLSFLGEQGWNLPAQMPAVGGTGALADRVSQMNQVYQQLQYTKGNPATEAQVRAQYNQRLGALGVNPQETSKFYYQGYNQFFNNEEWITSVLSQSGSGYGSTGAVDLRPYYNWWGLQRFGQAIPALKKIWIYTLASRELQGQNADPNMLLRFGEALEIGIPLGGDEPLNSINKQLRALLDIIDIAGRTGVEEISSVKFLRPVNVAKATLREPGATPPPAATPSPTPANSMGMYGGMDMMMGGMGMYGADPAAAAAAAATPVPDADRVGTGAGVELSLRADNDSLTRFYYELSHVTRTYGIDDLYVYNTQEGLFTTATVEVITDVNLQGATASAGGEMPL